MTGGKWRASESDQAEGGGGGSKKVVESEAALASFT